VRSYRTVSPLPSPRGGGGLFSVALSFESPRLAVSQHHALRSPDFPRRAPKHPPRPPRKILIIIEMNGSKKTHCWTFFGHSVNCTKGIDASPHTNYLQIFKKRPEPLGSGGAHCCASVVSTFSPVRATAYRLKGGAL
jgi:hypothetical protein